ncbi:hypothetical protein [Sediminihabitans luteus]|nr:hypothetical protein [Sediminihabitans luteus]
MPARHVGHGRPGAGLRRPPAGTWFPEQARELVELADPPLAPGH